MLHCNFFSRDAFLQWILQLQRATPLARCLITFALHRLIPEDVTVKAVPKQGWECRLRYIARLVCMAAV